MGVLLSDLGQLVTCPHLNLVLSPTHLRMRVWERGSGETLACGTGACAVVVAFTHLGRVPKGKPITVSLTGGDLIITYRNDEHVMMQGTATEVFRGQINF